MTRVVPFIVMCYGIQSYVVWSISPTEFSKVSLFVLGCFIAAMVGAFVTYDLNHKVKVYSDHLIITFLHLQKTVYFHEIVSLKADGPKDNFSSLILKTRTSTHRFYFIDDADKVKKMIEDNSISEKLAA